MMDLDYVMSEIISFFSFAARYITLFGAFDRGKGNGTTFFITEIIHLKNISVFVKNCFHLSSDTEQIAQNQQNRPGMVKS